MSLQKSCGACGAQVENQYNACPQCGKKINGGKSVTESKFDKIRGQLGRIITRINIKVNRVIFDVQRKIERFKLMRRYNKKKKTEEKSIRQAQQDEDFALKKAELEAMDAAVEHPVQEKTEGSQEDTVEASSEIKYEGHDDQQDLSSDELQEEINKLEKEEFSNTIEEKLTRNPLKLFSIIQIFMSLLFLAIGIISTQIITELVIAEDILILYSLIFVGIVIGIILWRYLFNRYYAKFLHLLVQHKFTRKIVAGGSFSFFEHKDPIAERIINKFTEPMGMVISTLISMLALATTVVGIIRKTSLELTLTDPMLWGWFALIIPMISTPIVPVIWGLQDARVKSYDKKTAANWLVSTRYKRRFNSFISISAIATNLKQGSLTSLDSIIEQLEILYSILRVGLFIILITVSVLVLFYYLGFRGYLRRITLKSLELKTYEILLIELELKQFQPKPIKVGDLNNT